MNVTKPMSASDIESLNQTRGIVLDSENVEVLNTLYYKKKDTTAPNNCAKGVDQKNVGTNTPSSVIQVTSLTRKVAKGQKVPLNFSSKKLRVNFGWNVNNPACDVDVSAFLLSESEKVVGDDYFVFYGQESSPEKSVLFKKAETTNGLEAFDIDMAILNPSVVKIVFVMTINHALENALNFSMLKDAYIQIVDPVNNTELVSFLIEEYYDNINSMMMGEIYLHNGAWKFNAIGNGMNRDLAGLCEFYGVQVV
jgi:tellurium resistance protein terD